MERATAEKLGKVIGTGVGMAQKFDVEKTKKMVKTAKTVKEKGKKIGPVKILAALVGVLTLIAAGLFAVYRFLLPDYLDDFEDDFEDDFDQDFFEEDKQQ